MKIAYVATNWGFGKENGVTKKIASQVNIWQNLGVETKLFTLSSNKTYWTEFDKFIKYNIYSPKTRDNFWHSIQLRNQIRAWQPDLVYWRFSLGYPALCDLVRIFPTILEINTYDLGELRASLPSSGLSYMYHLLTRGWIYSKIDGGVFVTHEIAEKFQQYTFSKYVLSNGIDLSTNNVQVTRDNSNPINIIFMASDDVSWHGIDKIFLLAHSFPNWNFEIIGNIKVYDPLPVNVILHGVLNRDEYTRILSQADIGIGTLSLYKKNMSEACPLKIREYLSCGIPCIIGYRDTDFPTGAPFLLQLPNTPDNVQNHLSEIEEFALSWKGRHVPREDILHLDYKFKENQRINFFKQVLASSFGKKRQI